MNKLRTLFVAVLTAGFVGLCCVQAVAGLSLVEVGGSYRPGDISLYAGSTAFAWDDITDLGYPYHNISNLNDGNYGNSHSWIGHHLPSSDIASSGFAGISFGREMTISSVAWGRGPEYFDRCWGTYTLQYTTAAEPGRLTSNDQWITIGSVTYDGNTQSPISRHEYAFDSVSATGIRLLVPCVWDQDGGGATCIDELEVYTPEPSTLVAICAGLPMMMVLRRRRL